LNYFEDTQVQLTTEESAQAAEGTIVSTVPEAEYPIARALTAVVVSTDPEQWGADGNAVPLKVIVQVATAVVPMVTAPENGVDPAMIAGVPAPQAETPGSASALSVTPDVRASFWIIWLPSDARVKYPRDVQ